MIKGQVAIESLVLVLVIISATIYFTGLYYQTHNTTISIGIARNALVEQANSFEELVIIQSIKKDTITNTIFVQTSPSTYTNTDFDLEKIKQKIIQNTEFEEINIEINSS